MQQGHGENQTVLSSIATQPEELQYGEWLSLNCFNSAAKNLKNTEFFKSKGFERACEFPVKSKPPVRTPVLENLGLILYCFSSGNACVLWVRTCLVITSDPQLSPTAAHSRAMQPKFPSSAQLWATASEENH